MEANQNSTILVTAFEPFGGDARNAALDAVRLLPPTVQGFELVKLTVPVEFDRCTPAVLHALAQTPSAAVLCVGQAAGRDALTPERIAINLMDARIPDNAGLQPVDRPIEPDGPAAYFSTLPVRRMVLRMQELGVPAQLSCSAGTFVCNRLMYGVLHALYRQRLSIPAGFLHVPRSEEQTAAEPGKPPCLPLRQLVVGLTAALESIASELTEHSY